MRPHTRLLVVLASLALLALLAAACDRGLPAPWRDLRFPLTNAEVMPGADEKGFTVTYRSGGGHEDLLREYQSALGRGGYTMDRECTTHDPTNKNFCVILKKGEKGPEKVMLTISGERPVQVKVQTRVD